MSRFGVRVLIVLTLLAAIAVYQLMSREPTVTVAWWVWAGIDVHDVPADAPLYLYQGIFDRGARFKPRGYFPHPIDRTDLALVFRLEMLPPASSVADVINRRVDRWRRHGIRIREVQLDFDAPTARLSEYAAFLAAVRDRIPSDARLTITGLGTWLLDGDREQIADLYKSVDAVAFQLYRGRRPIENTDWYIGRLRHFEHPFQVGLLPTMTAVDARLRTMDFKNLRGIIFFYQRT